MTRNQVLSAAIAIGLVSVLAFLVVKTRSVDFDAHNEIISTLRQLKQLDAEWNADVLRSKTGFNTNYDPVASPLPLIARLEATLQERTTAVLGSGEDGSTVTAAIDAYKKAMQTKIALIENFKSQNAILRNSSRYLPVAAHDLSAAVAGTAADGATKSRTDALVNQLVTGAMTYILTPDGSLRSSVTEKSASLGELSNKFAPELREQAGLFGSHVDTVLRQQDAGDKLLTELTTLPTATRIDALTDAYNSEHDQQLIAQQNYRLALIAYSALLLAGIAWLASRLFKSYRLLRRSNASLKKAHDDLKESQTYMVQSEKMSALGQMVAGIAHEINTPLAYVKGTIDLLAEQIGQIKGLARTSYTLTRLMREQADKATVKQHFLELEGVARQTIDGNVVEEMGSLLETGSHGIGQISEIVLNLKNFSRLDRAKVSEFNVQEGLDSTLLLAHNLLKNKVRIEKEFENVPPITCSPSQINQVFLNIISNAAQAIPDGRMGVLTLRTSQVNEDTVCVEIQDDGDGIPSDILPKIFDPFFTTKEIGKGTGMGLSISYKIIQEHGGRIEVNTEPGVGTVFSIELPVKPKQDSSAAETFEDDLLLAA